MGQFRDPAYITEIGRKMMTAGGDITYTKAVMYQQDISKLTDKQVKALTSIGSPVLTVPVGISDKQSVDGGTTVVLEATFQNGGLKADTDFSAVGFYAKREDEPEKLIAIAVADDGAYLGAANPDGVSYDAVDLKIAVTIGDATNVTAVVDPAGSVTPATLNGAISDAKHTLKANIDTKADKTTVDTLTNTVSANQTKNEKELSTKANETDVESSLSLKADKTAVNDLSDVVATKASQTSLDAAKTDLQAEVGANAKAISTTNATVTANKKATDEALATKANSADVDKQIKAVSDTVSDNKTSVDNSINSLSKTVTANKTDADDKIASLTSTVSANKKATDSVIATKANSTDVYSKTDVDKKIAAIPQPDLSPYAKSSTVNDALFTKVDKSTYKTDMAKKANSTDVTNSLSTKADKTDVDKKLATKADTADVDKALAQKADLSVLGDYVKAADVKTDLNGKVDVDVLGQYAKAASVDEKIAGVKSTVTSNKNATDKAISDTNATVTANKKAADSAIATKADKATTYTKKEVDTAVKAATDKANAAQSSANTANNSVASLKKTVDSNTSTIGTKADKSTIYTKTEIDSKLATHTSTINTKADKSTTYTKNEVNNLVNGRVPFYIGAANEDMNKYTTIQIRSYSSKSGLKNVPRDSTYLNYGTLLAFPDGNNNGSDGIQLWASPDGGVWTRHYNSGSFSSWSKLAFSSQVTDAKNSLTSLINSTKSTLQSAINTKAAASNVYTKTEVDSKVNAKANSADVYTKTQVDAKKSDSDSKITKAQNTANTANNTANKVNSKVNTDSNTYYHSPSQAGLFGLNNALASFRWEGSNSNKYALSGSLNGYGTGIIFGGNDTKGILAVGYSAQRAAITGGNRSTQWTKEIAWKDDINSTNSNVTKAQNTANTANSTANAAKTAAATAQSTANSATTKANNAQSTANGANSKATTNASDITTLKNQVKDLQNTVNQVKSTMPQVQTFTDEAKAQAWASAGGSQVRIGLVEN